MLTEAEAKQKWCPWAMTSLMSTAGSVASHNRMLLLVDNEPPKLPSACACIASACMAWRWMPYAWEVKPGFDRPEGEGWELIPTTSDNQVSRGWRRKKGSQQGYCGNAGEP